MKILISQIIITFFVGRGGMYSRR